jgi:hypothetical protein
MKKNSREVFGRKKDRKGKHFMEDKNPKHHYVYRYKLESVSGAVIHFIREHHCDFVSFSLIVDGTEAQRKRVFSYLHESGVCVPLSFSRCFMTPKGVQWIDNVIDNQLSKHALA